ncbi:UDP-N-acetylmuramoyl-L-alanyl-D-glutamate--2,6-diaminopimelate ligase [Shouchella hunanensis]|uniref:UDP-N-acetylmuramoyl-L-alanyl-D-glutamate--2, 6-diaminopimelate ligase n=1 Tax=Shouchella hunanensis TaxID=766894 RepID=A0ABY7W9K1_9BACI|nr:UDP-N-acetylmuramoyl-L-alanyl-D-glutamate--2,6-diaminopimelate ligase [Shouchella hunanensis]WDF05603.1 UDP-N-acetylmuramoyl-L-alanyl-D-glutamate--2,6-diaminopimelate ligase [Shouchella hunanensis]
MKPIHLLFQSIAPLPATVNPAQLIQGVTDRSSDVRPGYVFIAVKGYASDGHAFIHDAIRKGASVIVGEEPFTDLSVPYVHVSNSRFVLAKLASRFYEKNGKRPIMIGITGTNGKTTTSFMLKHLFETAGYSCALFGTVVTIINGTERTSNKNTTLGPIELHKQLAKSTDDIVIMEVSSHALSQHRVAGLSFDFALFTNLSHDHLDYHQTMTKYFHAKKTLFSLLHAGGKAIINTYDNWGKNLVAELKTEPLSLHTIGIGQELEIASITYGLPMKTTLIDNGESVSLNVPLSGEHNIYNAAMAYLTAKLMHLKIEAICSAFLTFKGAPGRFETFQHPSGAIFVIDYAHTEDAFSYCLQAIKQLGAKHITHIFGFRGGRDTGKRKAMIHTTEKWSHYIVLTFDDLNQLTSEEMRRTLLAIPLAHGEVVPDRTVAILKAWQHAKKGDWILITGKGHERYKQPFHYDAHSDKDMVEQLQRGTLKPRHVTRTS